MVFEISLVLLLLVEFCGYAFALHRQFAIPLSVAPPLATSAVILVLYAADFMGALRLTSWVLHAMGMACGFYGGWLTWRSSGSGMKGPWTSGGRLVFPLCILVLVVGLFLLDRSGAYAAWDEFSHWGTVIRAVYDANTFHFESTPLYFQDYPPGMALFSYHVLTVIGYTEGHAYFSYSLLLLCFLTPIVTSASRVNESFALFVLAAAFYLVFGLGSGWASVLIDQVLAVLLAGTVAAYFQLQRQRGSLFVVPILLGSLVLAKHAGQSFAMLAAAICVADLIVLRIATGNREPAGRKASYFRRWDIPWLLALFGFPLVVSATWQHHVTMSGLSSSLGSHSLVEFAKQSMECCSTPRVVDIAGKFFAAVLDLAPPATNEVRPLYGYAEHAFLQLRFHDLLFKSREFAVGKIWLLLTIFGVVVAAFFPNWQQRSRYLTLSLILSVGAIFYSLSLLLFYLYGFSEYEGRQLASFDRFHNVFLLAWAILLLFVIAELLTDLQSSALRQVVMLLVVCVSFYAVAPPALQQFLANGAKPLSDERRAVRDWASRVAIRVPKDARVFIGWQGSNGRELWMVRYELLPRRCNYNCYSLGLPGGPEDIYTCNLTIAEIERVLGNYDYYAVGKGLKSLREYYRGFFDGPPPDADDALFRIDRSANGVHLVYVPT